jgi:cobalamin biosynthesis protein CobT
MKVYLRQRGGDLLVSTAKWQPSRDCITPSRPTMSDTEMLDGTPHEREQEPSEEGEGDDIGAISDDSSDEGATDEEEAANIRKDFIVDDDDEEVGYSDEEVVQKQRKKRRRKREYTIFFLVVHLVDMVVT